MSDEKILSKAISRDLKGSFIKWLAIGFGIAVVTGGIVGIGIYFGIPDTTPPDIDDDAGFSTNLAESVSSSFPNVVHMEIIGNGTAQINSRLIWAYFDRIGDSISYEWTVSAEAFNPEEQVNFNLSKSQVDEIAVSLFDSINKTSRVGTYGQEPYPTDQYQASLKFVTEIYFENNTVIFLFVDLDGLVLFKSLTWHDDYQYSQNLLGAAVLIPESAFDDYITVLSNLFAPHF
ncbi:MAG: hypothetical protein KAU62_14540 [Candidatus Heimdallarchaeota archaeon]|nr:hypothetical protein [Candidatus Heimdallarchaeota archaeon]MCK4612369.1 hypothetical protein [Candidatus Heimdallarchaeota archaeon]